MACIMPVDLCRGYGGSTYHWPRETRISWLDWDVPGRQIKRPGITVRFPADYSCHSGAESLTRQIGGGDSRAKEDIPQIGGANRLGQLVGHLALQDIAARAHAQCLLDEGSIDVH